MMGDLRDVIYLFSNSLLFHDKRHLTPVNPSDSTRIKQSHRIACLREIENRFCSESLDKSTVNFR
jgi:hypothetical protein